MDRDDEGAPTDEDDDAADVALAHRQQKEPSRADGAGDCDEQFRALFGHGLSLELRFLRASVA